MSARDERSAPEGTGERAREKFERTHVAFAVADSGPGPAGFALVTVPGSGVPEDPPEAAYLAMVAVSPERQSAGLGSLLLDDVTARARTAGHRMLVLHVLLSNVRAVRLYREHGWHPLGRPAPHSLSGAFSQTYVRRL
ncbi:GNAT family N-acetyltransferase [Leifsonia sp. NPDC058230]|uniref:GNAT family N-acetyltransferase n=1 Tax=Leifsonia sp. NPDC058230 TaxID=3346391 RepID=UPI0036D9E906